MHSALLNIILYFYSSCFVSANTLFFLYCNVVFLLCFYYTNYYCYYFTNSFYFLWLLCGFSYFFVNVVSLFVLYSTPMFKFRYYSSNPIMFAQFVPSGRLHKKLLRYLFAVLQWNKFNYYYYLKNFWWIDVLWNTKWSVWRATYRVGIYYFKM